MTPVKIKTAPGYDMVLPQYARIGDAGMDVRACIPNYHIVKLPYKEQELSAAMQIQPGQHALIPTGLSVAIPIGFEIQVRPRSGLALKQGVTVLNTPGTVDAAYRGEIGVILHNTSDQPFIVEHGMRIAQLVLKRVETIHWELVDELDETERGNGGFGSTGE